MKTGMLTACIAAALALSPVSVLAGDNLEKRTQASRMATQELIQNLGKVLKKQMQTGGPDAAIRVCRDVAPAIAGQLSRDNGWRVTRVSNKVRNPLLGTPDAWEHEVLTKFEAEVAEGASPAGMEFSEVVTEADGVRYFRYMKAIGTKPICLTCHGPREQIPASVKEATAPGRFGVRSASSSHSLSPWLKRPSNNRNGRGDRHVRTG